MNPKPRVSDPLFHEMFGPLAYDANNYPGFGAMSQTIHLMQLFDPNGPHNIVHLHASEDDETKMKGRTFPTFDRKAIAAYGNKLNANHYNTYVSVNRPRPGAPDKKLNKTHIAYYRAVVADLDLYKGEDRADGFKRMQVLVDEALPPTIVVHTRNGLQCWWMLQAPIPASPEMQERVEAVGLRAALWFDSDHTQNIDRVFRCPGTVNYPNAAKKKRGYTTGPSAIHQETGIKYTLEDIEAAFPEVAGSGIKTVSDEAVSKEREQARTELDMKVAKEMHVWADLPEGLRDRFEAALQSNENLDQLWRDGVPDNDGSVAIAGLAGHLVRIGGFTVTDYGSLLQVWDHAEGNKGAHNAKGLGNADARSIWRMWGAAVAAQTPGDPRDTFDAVAEDGEGDGEGEDKGDGDKNDPLADLEQADIDLGLLNPTGLVGEVAEFIDSTAIAPCRVHAVGAGLAVVGALLLREVYTFDAPTSSALYTVNIAASGSGKQHSINAVKVLLDEASGSLGPIYDGWKESSAMLMASLQQRPAKLQVIDEFADQFLGLRQKVGGNAAIKLSGIYRELWGILLGSYISSEALSRRGNKPINRPALSLWGFTTTKLFIDMMTSTSIANGLLNRFLLLPYFGHYVPSRRLTTNVLTVPKSLAAKLQALFRSANNNQLPDPQSTAPQHLVPMTEAALDLDYENRMLQANKLLLADEHLELALYARYAEQIKRIALIVACGNVPHQDISKAIIDEPEMKFAQGLVAWSIGQMVVLARDHMAENENQLAFKQVRSLIFRAPGDKGISQSDLNDKLRGRMKRPDIQQTILLLRDAGQISIFQVKGKIGGPIKTIYRPVRGRF